MNRWEGRLGGSKSNLERPVELDPRNSSTITDLAWVYMPLRKYEEADALAIRLQAVGAGGANLASRSSIYRARSATGHGVFACCA